MTEKINKLEWIGHMSNDLRLYAIYELLFEIAQNTKDLNIGQDAELTELRRIKDRL